MKKITRADLRGKKLKSFCYKAKISKNELGLQDNRNYCYDLIDKMTDELIDDCKVCKANVIYVSFLEAQE